MESAWLSSFKHDVYSQSGEDGIIEKILERIPSHDKWCVEFGAFDGLYLSNTRNLIESKGYSAVLIEGNPDSCRELQRNYAQQPKVITMNRYVGFTESDNLDLILRDTPIPNDFDLLSIDIDGNDYHVWKNVVRYTPKVLVIEFNPTIPTNIQFVQPANQSINQGSSLLSLVELGKQKGYELVSVLPFNAFFVRREYYPLFHIENNSPETLRTEADDVTYIFSGFDGTVFLRGSRRLPWHRIHLQESDFQPLPKVLRSYPGSYSRAQRILYQFFMKFRNTCQR